VRKVLPALLLAGLLLGAPAAAGAAAPVEPYQNNDYKGFRDILPPGTNGLANGPGLAAFLASGARPAHNDDQLGMYRDLVYASPGITSDTLPNYFKDSSFGVRPGDVERTYSPGGRDDVTVVRDKGYGVPHVYATTRQGAMYALGYAAAEDRLFFIDVLRHLGRAQLASFAGGAPGNRAFDQMEWSVAPYTEADLERQIQLGLARFGAEGQQVQSDSEAYVAGINRYITEAKMDPTKMPGEYAAINQPGGPDPWKQTDLIATAALVGGIFGKGGGGEVVQAQLLQAWQDRFGRARGAKLWRQLNGLDDPDTNNTIKRKRFDYQQTPRRRAAGANAIPDKGSVTSEPIVESGVDARATQRSAERTLHDNPGGLVALPHANSNALLVSARESASGRPIAVFGPQVAYFAPQILMEQDVHAPGIDARGASFPGVNLYVQLGHGRDYAWSATSAGQDIIDTFAVELCNPDGTPATKLSDHYVFRGQCLPMEILRRTNTWSPNAADSTPAGTQTLRAFRTKLGLVRARALIRGKPVAYVELRSTYMHEIESAGGFSDFNNPDKMRNAADFQRAASKIGYTFNWFYIDDQDIAYYNSGNNPARPAGVDPLLPTWSRFEWKGLDPDDNTATYTGFATHPQIVNQQYLTSWNNRQAPGYNNGYYSVHRADPLDEGVKAGIAGSRKMTLPELVDAMENAATTDLRGHEVLPLLLDVLGRQTDPRLQEAIDKLRAWERRGAHRIDRDRDGVYEDSDAITILDAWWPKLLEAEFIPVMGQPLFNAMRGHLEYDNQPNNHGDHLGSAYQDGWYGFVSKDLRTILRRKVRGRYARVFCGTGNLARCRRALAESLRAAIQTDRSTMYQDDACAAAGKQGDQWCYDSIRFRPLGGITQPLIAWQNRPTYQQAVEIQGHRPR
jgi:acyl-homoserine lactone acylase PvdQ